MISLSIRSHVFSPLPHPRTKASWLSRFLTHFPSDSTHIQIKYSRRNVPSKDINDITLTKFVETLMFLFPLGYGSNQRFVVSVTAWDFCSWTTFHIPLKSFQRKHWDLFCVLPAHTTESMIHTDSACMLIYRHTYIVIWHTFRVCQKISFNAQSFF